MCVVEKCKADLQRLKDEVQQLSTDLKTQEQQSQHQLAGEVTQIHTDMRTARFPTTICIPSPLLMPSGHNSCCPCKHLDQKSHLSI